MDSRHDGGKPAGPERGTGEMVILGLTGSIGMGKSTAAANFRRAGVPIHDADATVHALLAEGGEAVDAINALFPGVVVNGAVDRERVAVEVFSNAAALKRIESILHPMVRERERKFLGQAARQGRRLVVLDVPLLFETGGEKRCDGVVTVS
ncbi:MAG: dephospho-CoA kinase, partial [Rhodospirillales bacterium]